MTKIAIIGTGIAGMGCGHFLHKHYDITLYEANDYVGGHTNTVTVDEDGRNIPIDTGFMVFNEINYPNLVKLFKELDVETKPTDMSFSVQHIPSGLEYSGSGFDGLFAQRKNIFNPRHIKMLMQIGRFNTESVIDLESGRYDNYSLSDYVREKKYGDDFLYKYLSPMSSALWSTPTDITLQFPAVALIRFFKNHGFLGLNTQHTWLTVHNGSCQYRDKLIAPFKEKIHIKRPVVKISRENKQAIVHTADGASAVYDKVILACHADQSLKMLEDPTGDEQLLLSNFKYQQNRATLHTDTRIMPKNKKVWSSWNYRIEGKNGSLTPSTIYYMNSLQKVSDKKHYFVSINDPDNIKTDYILKDIKYDHPIFTVEAYNAQKELPKLNQNGIIYFCGSYFKYGFHEDAFTSAIDLCKTITGKNVWDEL